MKLSTILHTVYFILFVSPASCQKPKILCLHGGGGNGDGFRFEMGDLREALKDEYEFVYPTAPYGSGNGKLWIKDPPGGKDEPTQDPNWADQSIAVLDQIVAEQGPFYGILGYSQGAAFVPVYLSRVLEGTFSIALTFCGYPTLTHEGLLGVVETQQPFGDIPHLIWLGENDVIISNDLTLELVQYFTDPLVVTSTSGGHNVVDSGDSTFGTVTSFIRGDDPPPTCEEIKEKKACKNAQCIWNNNKKKCVSPPDNKCEGIQGKKSCKATKGCKWNKTSKRCEEDDNEKPGDKCDEIKKKNVCKKTSGCLWNKNKCNGCQSIPQKKKCKATEGCSWDTGKKVCYADLEKPGDKCEELKSKQCKDTEGCSWDKEKKCYEDNDKPGEKCEDNDTKDKCDSDSNCTWYEDGDKSVCYEDNDKPGDKCEDNDTKDKCDSDSNCTWYEDGDKSVCYEEDEKPVEKCEDNDTKDKCESNPNCTWYDEGDKSVCYEGK